MASPNHVGTTQVRPEAINYMTPAGAEYRHMRYLNPTHFAARKIADDFGNVYSLTVRHLLRQVEFVTDSFHPPSNTTRLQSKSAQLLVVDYSSTHSMTFSALNFTKLPSKQACSTIPLKFSKRSSGAFYFNSWTFQNLPQQKQQS